MKLTKRQTGTLLNYYRRQQAKSDNSVAYSCSKCKINSNTLSKEKFVLYNIKQNKIVNEAKDIFSEALYEIRWLEACHYWSEKNDYVIGESAIKLFCNVKHTNNDLVIPNKTTYPMGRELNMEMLSSTQQEIDDMLDEYNKHKKHKTKWITIKSKKIDIYDSEITQEQRIDLIKHYRSIQDIEAETWISKNIDNLKLFCLNCS